jgi:hypothetical protein
MHTRERRVLSFVVVLLRGGRGVLLGLILRLILGLILDVLLVRLGLLLLDGLGLAGSPGLGSRSRLGLLLVGALLLLHGPAALGRSLLDWGLLPLSGISTGSGALLARGRLLGSIAITVGVGGLLSDVVSFKHALISLLAVKGENSIISLMK